MRLVEGDAEVEFIGQELDFDAVLGHFPDRDGDAGVAVVQFGDQGADEVGGERGSI